MSAPDRFELESDALDRALMLIVQSEADGVVTEARRAARSTIISELRAGMEAALRQAVLERVLAETGTHVEEAPGEEGIEGPDEGSGRQGAPTDDMGWYVFAVTQGTPASVEGWPGIDPVHSTVGFSVDGLVAVACLVEMGQFDEKEFRAHIDDVEWLEAKVRAHESVLERLLEVGPTLPMRFGSIYRTPEDVRATLRQHAATLRAGLDRVRGREEWSVRTRLDRTVMEEWVRGRMDGPSDASLANRGEGAAYLAERARDRAVTEALEAEASRISALVEGSLSDLAVEAARADTPARRGVDVMFELAFLVERSRTREFLGAVARLRGEIEARGIQLEVTGPWPPASFTSMELTVEAGS